MKMSDLTDSELVLALNGECHTAEVAVWLAREVKRCREAQHTVVQKSNLTDLELALALNGECHNVELVVWLAREVKRYREAQQAVVAPKSQGTPEIFPFVTLLHREVVLRPKDGESQDIEMTPDEADRVAYLLRAAAVGARGTWYGAWYGTVVNGTGVESQEVAHVIQLSGNAPLEIFPLQRKVVLRHKDSESQDIEMTADEACCVADQLCAAATAAREAKVET
jgi:hypothetical protein